MCGAPSQCACAAAPARTPPAGLRVCPYTGPLARQGPPPPQPRARLRAGPPPSLPGALPGENPGSVETRRAPGQVATPTPTSHPRLPEDLGAPLTTPRLDLTPIETAPTPVGWGGRFGIGTRRPGTRTARGSGRGNWGPPATVGGDGASGRPPSRLQGWDPRTAGMPRVSAFEKLYRDQRMPALSIAWLPLINY